jgi:3D (Asp-Asp-Asp) domain-containing protein
MFYNKKALKKYKKIFTVIFIAFIFEILCFPAPALADDAVAVANAGAKNLALDNIDNNTTITINPPDIENHLPANKNKITIPYGYHVITSYNSEVGQCDDSPCITANGFNVCEHGIEDTVAANFLSFGTKIKIPDYFGDRVFIVRDRMNARYTDRLDIWMINKSDAIQWGAKIAKIEIIQ